MADKVIYRNHKFSVERIEVPIGRKIMSFERVKAPDAVTVLAMPDNVSLLIERGYRPALKRMTVELPFGLLQNGEKPVDAAKRVIKEQTGYVFGNYTLMLKTFMNPYITTQKDYFYIAKNKKTMKNVSRDGMSSFTAVKFDALRDMVERNYIKDNKTIAGILYYINTLMKK
ncbi:MAG: NUDIX hydrolase [Candidatus Marsarchaeota archaeon]|jgi:ADP-ribose pyrophosphatase|nr:NUDIX hydrolase [Candidatus Marsarchaeota archaeon]